MKTSAFLTSLIVGLTTVSAASARMQASDRSALAMDRILSPAVQPLYVTSVAVQPYRPFPDVYTAVGKNVSPAVAWDGGPPGVRSYVVIMEDQDSHGAAPALHWLAYNIPGGVKFLGKNVHNRGDPKTPLGMLQGINYAGGVGYIGPNPPKGDPPHHYHIQVFALDRVLNLKPKLGLDKVIASMNDHVMAEGEVIATFVAPPPEPVAAKHAAADGAAG